MDRFEYESEPFREELRSSPHLAGEVHFLCSIARPGMHVFDVGANRGVTAVALAKAIGSDGHVYALEPVPEYYRQLKENLSLNRADNVSAYPLALGDRSGRIRFYKHGGGSGIVQTEGAEPLWVYATTAAHFIADRRIGRIDLLSMDCEGSELRVLEGARQVLQKDHPQIFCEIHREYLDELGQSVDDVAEFLRDLGYDLRPLRVENLGADTDIDECSHIYAKRPPSRNHVEHLKKQIADLKDRMPAHSVSPSMMQELEDLEDELKGAQQTTKGLGRGQGERDLSAK